MLAFYGRDVKDAQHSMKVYAFAKAIAELEGLPPAVQERVEVAAVVHDIACPLCREKYGHADGAAQERESAPLVQAFLGELGYAPAFVQRISYLVCHHHTYTDVDGADYQILLEADFLVNAYEEEHSVASIASMRKKVFQTKAGLGMLDALYPPAL